MSSSQFCVECEKEGIPLMEIVENVFFCKDCVRFVCIKYLADSLEEEELDEVMDIESKPETQQDVEEQIIGKLSE